MSNTIHKSSSPAAILGLVALAAASIWANSAAAYFYVPIAGIDQTASQYICKQQAGLKSTIQEVKSGGAIVERSTSSVVKSLTKQVEGVQSKLNTVISAMKGANGKQLQKLKKRKAELKAQLQSLRFVKARVGECSRSVLLFSATGSPMFLSSSFTYPGYGLLSGYLYGMLFTPPKNWNGDYCVVISGASTTISGLPTTKYTDFVEQEAYVRSNCIALGGVPFCAPGFESDQLMVVLAQGILSEAPGTCGTQKPWQCSITETSSKLSSSIGGAFMHSLRPKVGSCGQP